VAGRVHHTAGAIPGRPEDNEVESGKTALLAMIQQLDSAVQVVIPTRATNDRFLISLSKGKGREFISLAEDDLIDCQTDPTIRREVEETVKKGLAKLQSPG
jgi:hypothetical protein